MNIDDDVCYRALIARDARFDGVFFVGVRSTGIYCRPVCTAKTPGRERCRFFASAALAEQAGFRPCLRCRPELAPGHAPVDSPRTIARAAAARIEAGALSNGGSLEELAAGLGVGVRQLRRSVRRELGVSPVELAQTNRLLLAKRLIAETDLPMVQVAFAAGFESVRRFNALFRSHYRLTPSTMRRSSSRSLSENGPRRRGQAHFAHKASQNEPVHELKRGTGTETRRENEELDRRLLGASPPFQRPADCLRLTLAYRPPLDWAAMLRFLAARAIPGVECVTEVAYQRTVGIGEHRGWLRVSPVANRNLLAVELSTALAPALSSILMRLRNLFDLDARPDVIAGHLGLDPLLAPLVERQPGLRVPGAFDSFELGMRAVLGQQVSVRGASTLAGRFAERFGEPIATPLACLNRIAPTAEAIAGGLRGQADLGGQAHFSALASNRGSSVTGRKMSQTPGGLGLPNARAESLRSLASAVARREIDLDPGIDPTAVVARLVELPGIGPWTAEYIAMRALRWPDAFPAADLGLMKAVGLKSARAVENAAERWRPWRAYAAMHLWKSLRASSTGG
jgi:AraC family transcriptional regulator of adaptative response / DNA-3-methyladenine glycosylase II